jgi:hypothetical protein
VEGEDPLFTVRILKIPDVHIAVITVDDRRIATAWCVVIADPQEWFGHACSPDIS